MVRCVGAIHAAYFLIIVSEKALGGASGKHDIGKCAALIIQGLCISKHRGIASPAFPRCNQMGMKGNGVKIKLLAIFGSMLCTASLLGESFSLAPIGGGEKPANSANDVVKVRGKGVGANKTEALKDAYRDAVERAVGLFVDAEQMIKNDEILKDQVLTQSNAYIEKYDLVKESEVGGLVHVDILAVVRKSALVTKVSGFMPVQTQDLGNTMQNLHAKIVSTEKRNEDGAALLQNFMNDFDPIRQMVGVGLASTTPVVRDLKNDPSRKAVLYRYKFSLDDNRYKNDFLPKIRQLLTQVSVAPVKKFRLTAQQGRNIIDFALQKDQSKFMQGDLDQDIMNYYVRPGKGLYEKRLFLSANIDNLECLFTGCGKMSTNISRPFKEVRLDGGPARYTSQDEKIVSVLLVTEFNSQKTSCVAEWYSVDQSVGLVFKKWWVENLAKQEAVPCVAVFKDAQGVEVEVARFKAKVNCLTIVGKFDLGKLLLQGRGRYREGDFHSRGIYISPLLGCDGIDYCQWVPCAIQKDDLARIASVSVELGN